MAKNFTHSFHNFNTEINDLLKGLRKALGISAQIEKITHKDECKLEITTSGMSYEEAKDKIEEIIKEKDLDLKISAKSPKPKGNSEFIFNIKKASVKKFTDNTFKGQAAKFADELNKILKEEKLIPNEKSALSIELSADNCGLAIQCSSDNIEIIKEQLKLLSSSGNYDLVKLNTQHSEFISLTDDYIDQPISEKFAKSMEDSNLGILILTINNKNQEKNLRQ